MTTNDPRVIDKHQYPCNMALIRTKRLAAGQHVGPFADFNDVRASVGIDIYTVPQGYRAVIHEIRVTLISGAVPTAYLKVFNRLSGGQYIYLAAYKLDSNTIPHADTGLSIVMNAGETLRFSSYAPTDYYVCGAELTTPA